jgi:transposase-like protein
MLLKNGMVCICGSDDLDRKPGTRRYKCRTCKRSRHFTSGTLFEGVAKLRAWLGTIILLGNGVAVSSNKLSRLFDIAQATAHCMHKKILAVVAEQSLEESHLLMSHLFDEVICRRSRESAPERHPVNDDADAAEERTEKSNNFEIVTVGSFSTNVVQAVSHIIAYIAEYFQGVSRKCLHLYLASFWRFFDRKSWSASFLLKVCLHHEPIPYRNLLLMRSTKMVRVHF